MSGGSPCTPKSTTPHERKQHASATFLVAALATQAGAQAQCGDREAVLQILADRYGESRRVAGLTPEGQLVEMFGNEETGSWTMTVTFPDGRMCLLSMGAAFEAYAAVPMGDPA